MCSQQQLNTSQAHAQTVAGFDVGVDVPSQRGTTHHTNRGFGAWWTAPDNLRHDETALRARDYETVAIPLSYARTGLV